jgi:hypothetical protein
MKQYKVSFLKNGCFYVNAKNFHVHDDTIIFFKEDGQEIKEIIIPKEDVKIEILPEEEKIQNKLDKSC